MAYILLLIINILQQLIQLLIFSELITTQLRFHMVSPQLVLLAIFLIYILRTSLLKP